MKNSIHQDVTQKIIEQLEQGVAPWQKQWTANGLPLRHNGTPYKGINTLLLGMAQMMAGYTGNTWLTYRQAKAMKAFVRKGEHGTRIVFASTFKKTVETGSGDEETRDIPFLKSYTVFNTDQINGLPDELTSHESLSEADRVSKAEQFFGNLKADVHHGGDQAFYSPQGDYIQLPTYSQFKSSNAYYAVRAHESVHWTGHESRLDRLTDAAFGSEDYAKEELVAELGAAYLCADLELAIEPRKDHASYLASWLKILKADNRAIFRAATSAQAAVDYLHTLR